MKRISLILIASLMLCSQEAVAWGGWAHKLIAVIAESHLTPEAKAATEKYLGSPIYDHASWMDQVPLWNKKRIPGWEQTSWWHMTTVDKVGKKSYVEQKARIVGRWRPLSKPCAVRREFEKLPQLDRFGCYGKSQMRCTYGWRYALSLSHLLHRV